MATTTRPLRLHNHDATPRAGVRTVGVEEEFLLVDGRTGVPVPLAAAVIARAADASRDPVAARRRTAAGPRVKFELQQEMVEVTTLPRSDLAQLRDDLRELRRDADRAARDVGARLAALATSPLPAVPRLSPFPRYQAISRTLGVTCDEQLTCGCHVHVAVESDEEGVGVLDRMRPWLPVLAAVATNSPYWNGQDTGYASYRTQAWSRWPTTGPTDVFGSARRYHELVDELIATGTPLDEDMVYFDARLSRHYPTVEIRVADVCLEVEDAALVAGLARALVDTAALEWRSGVTPASDPTALLRLASWRASRSGTDGDLLHPRLHRLRPAAEVLDALVEHVRPALERSGDLADVRLGVERLLQRGTGARAQRRVVADGGGLDAVVAYAVERTCAAG